MKKFIWTCIEVMTAIIALMIAVGAFLLGVLGMRYMLYLVFIAIIIYHIIPRRWGVIGYSGAIIIASIYFIFMFLSAIVEQPVFCLMSSVLSLSAVGVMLKGKPWWTWIVVTSIFLIIGVFYVFNNDIVGPMEFRIQDMPINTPTQWYYCYRFFWTGFVIEMVTYIAGFVSIIFLSSYTLGKKAIELYKNKEL
ncbi:MAG: hypothetical protein IJ159_05415 [Prevotella sp.]|nr:hypothetical protein [Prevotella sp.]